MGILKDINECSDIVIIAGGGGMKIAQKEIRTRGLAIDAWMTLMRNAFTELRLNRVNGSAPAYNKVSLRIC